MASDKRVASAVLTLTLEDGSAVTYRINSPDAASVRTLALPIGDWNHGGPAREFARQFTITFGWRNGRH